MGLDCSIYIGPYLNVTPKKEKQVHIVNACGNEECTLRHYGSHHAGIKFCPNCGGKIHPIKMGEGLRTFFVHEEDDWIDADLEDVMYSPETEDYLFIPNKGGLLYSWHVNRDNAIIDLSTVNAEQAINKFATHADYERFIEFLNAHEFEYLIEYGLVQYWA